MFNALTGLKQKTSNFAGTTVDKKSGSFDLNLSINAELTDLPGTYSIYAKSSDERVATDILLYNSNNDYPDKVIVVADALNLKRSLLLCTQILDLGLPTVLALNMVDLAEKKNIRIDVNQLSQLLSIPVVIVNARKRYGLDRLKETLLNLSDQKPRKFYEINPAIQQFLDELKPVFNNVNDYINLVHAHRTGNSSHEMQNIYKVLEKYEYHAARLQQKETIERFKKIDYIIAKCVTKIEGENASAAFSHKADKFICHPIYGLFFFIALMLIVFQSVFTLADYPKNLIEGFFVSFADFLRGFMPNNWFTSLLAGGILPGLNGLLSFLPQIAILFAILSVLEDSGYMARVSFIMDSFMRKFGLSGKSVIPLMGGMACAVPSILATRNIENNRDRLLTLFVTPLMSCSARLPVYSLLISLFVSKTYILGFISLQGLMLLFMYLLGFISAIALAFIMKFFVKQNIKSFFVMELPVYKWPSFRNLRLNVYERSKTFVTEAGLVIVMVSVVIYFLGTFGPGQEMQKLNLKYEKLEASHLLSSEELNVKKQAEQLEASYAGHFGKLIEPVIKPLGFDWKIGISLLTSFVAREVFVGTMYTIYSIGDTNSEISLKDKMLAEKDAITSKPIYSAATALSLMLFYAFALQCTSTIAVVYRETKNLKWPIIQFLVMGIMAYVSSYIVYALTK